MNQHTAYEPLSVKTLPARLSTIEEIVIRVGTDTSAWNVKEEATATSTWFLSLAALPES